MATRDELLRLAERCEAATGSSDALDFDIATAIPSLRGKGLSPTSSLDAALTLVPEGWHIWSFRGLPEGGTVEAILDGEHDHSGIEARGKTRAGTMAAAALRARAASAVD